VHDPMYDGGRDAARPEDGGAAANAEGFKKQANGVDAGSRVAGGVEGNGHVGAESSQAKMEDVSSGADEKRLTSPIKVQRTSGGKANDWRIWPGGPPGTGSGIGEFGGGRSEAWGFYDRADQVDALLAYLNPQVVSMGGGMLATPCYTPC
jgi:hypothetical protein